MRATSGSRANWWRAPWSARGILTSPSASTTATRPPTYWPSSMTGPCPTPSRKPPTPKWWWKAIASPTGPSRPAPSSQSAQQVRGGSLSQAGEVLLALAALASFVALVSSLVGRFGRRPGAERVGMWSLYALLTMTSAAFLLLLAAFLARDFSVLYVYEHSSRALSAWYTVSALWAGNAGSLLLWLLMLAAFAVAAARRARIREGESPVGGSMVPYLVASLSAMGLFFSLLLLFGPSNNPFAANTVAGPHRRFGPQPDVAEPGHGHPSIGVVCRVRGHRDPVRAARRGSHQQDRVRRLARPPPSLDSRGLALPHHRQRRGRLVGLCHAWLGRILGLGPGGECLADPLAHCYRPPPRDRDGPNGKASSACGWRR